MNNTNYTTEFCNAIDDGLLRKSDSIYIGLLYNSPFVILKYESGKCWQKYYQSWSIDDFDKSDQDYDRFPFGRLTFIDSKPYIYTKLFYFDYFKSPENLNEKKEYYYNHIKKLLENEEFGIQIKKITRLTNKTAFDTLYTESFGVYLEFTKKMKVSFIGDNDFPVIILPKRTSYVVK